MDREAWWDTVHGVVNSQTTFIFTDFSNFLYYSVFDGGGYFVALFPTF